ncbi:MAG: LLM class flavin-dependent oxidoreductase [Proteobacteria bacterium]|jgi:alkanesulfonate monooxygenase SsuD/methylene tetrahydromethanopterin reductase-like flavin-dependent oxidoreductase (luciferase family)|nr:LLM class flavin-dependent oxidoreductase [Pseudomonadota bacterium]MBT5066460.1 LLM class flavin-dependent oxidoreductase [Pseudomonadota bacterium]MBT6193542.1 LLM class flavin-dependent oxidoreductase [Pseudomonadota bacterium]MBT6466011.1 LLM class flavin-dependent oxidoreductase [Pseudomonadota bacterium]MBT6674920.1 LLM class flavin-dependent oxidoreductase [Pseudomonadota bacterium]
MDFGITFPSYIRAYHDVKMAEDYGFTHAWFYDSQMCYSDVYATMALAAEHSRYIKLGTLVSILGNRIAPVTAHSIATINELAPGRVILGVGSGFTGRNVMGMPPAKLKTMRHEIEVIKKLLKGQEARYIEGTIERDIRFLNRNEGYINVRDGIPLYMASNGPKANDMVGELADGWVTIGLNPEYIKAGIAQIKAAAKNHGRNMRSLYTTNLTSGCVLRPGEDIMSPRVIRQVGPSAILLLHTNWDPKKMMPGPFAPPEVAGLAKKYYTQRIMKMKTPMSKRYQEMHAGHLTKLQKGEAEYLTPELIKLATLTGSPAEIIDRVKELEDAGITNLALNVCGTDARNIIREFGNEVIAKL